MPIGAVPDSLVAGVARLCSPSGVRGDAELFGCPIGFPRRPQAAGSNDFFPCTRRVPRHSM